MLYAHVSLHERRFVISLEFPCNDHCYSSRHNSHNMRIPWFHLRLYWPARPNIIMYESIYVWQTMIWHVRDRLEPWVTFQPSKGKKEPKGWKWENPKWRIFDIWPGYRRVKRFHLTYLAFPTPTLHGNHEYKACFPEFIKTFREAKIKITSFENISRLRRDTTF